MADFGASTDPVQRYAAIEKAYTEDRWEAVIEQGTLLLNDLPWISGGAPDGLKERIQLLVAHAHLYGFGQRDQAQRLYQAVIGSGGEPALQQIAEQGLKQCIAMPAAVPEAEQSLSEPGIDAPPPAREAAAPQAAAESLSPPSPEAPEEPATTPATSAWATASSPATPSEPGAVVPVMPWLTATSLEPATKAFQPAPVEPLSSAPVEPVAPAGPVVTAIPEAVEPAPPAHGIEERLIPEVIEEPELIEVHQADPARAEDVVVAVRESLAPAQADDDLDGEPAPTWASTETPSPEPQIIIRTLEEPTAAPTPTTAQGVGVFRNPPAAVAKEDPELLLGLLRVQMG